MKVGGGKLNRRSFVLSLVALILFTWNCGKAVAYQPFEPFSFAYVTDIHLTNSEPDTFKLTRESQLFLQQLVKQLNNEKVDFVVFGGDQVETIGKDEANWQLFLDILQGLNAPWNFVLGETDVSGNFSVDKRKTFGPDWKQRGIETETSYWSHNLSQQPMVHLIGLDTSIPNSTIGGVSQRQLDWLKKDLEANKRHFTIIFSHHPLLPPAPYDSGPPWDEYVIPDGGAVREIIGSHPNVKMVISGHTHVSKVQNERDVWHISSPSLAVYPCAFRVFQVTPQAVTMETVPIDFPALIKKARKELIDSTIASRYNREDPGSFVAIVEGAREDQHAIIPLVPGKPLQEYSPEKARKEKEKEQRRAEKEQKKRGQEKAETKPAKESKPTKSEKTKPKVEPATSPSTSPSTEPTPEPNSDPTADLNELLKSDPKVDQKVSPESNTEPKPDEKSDSSELKPDPAETKSE
jgi:predicted phosphodiesterase